MDVEPLCCRCSGSRETVEHFLLECPFSKRIWRASNLGFNFDMGTPVRVEDWLAEWVKQASSRKLILESFVLLGP